MKRLESYGHEIVNVTYKRGIMREVCFTGGRGNTYIRCDPEPVYEIGGLDSEPAEYGKSKYMVTIFFFHIFEKS